jgi:hypothetical protein
MDPHLIRTLARGLRETTSEGLMTTSAPNWQQLLLSIFEQPGRIHDAYRAFHNFSFRNQLMVTAECFSRGIAMGPIATYRGWLAKGRQVKKGEKALPMWMPLLSKKKSEANKVNESEDEAFVRFAVKNRWFVLSQTEGEAVPEPTSPEWNAEAAMKELKVVQIAFEDVGGNTMGYATGNSIAISPLAPLPHKTRFHEMAHVLMKHTESRHGEQCPKSIMEVEAESVALICCEALGLPGAEFCRGYIRGWLGDAQEIPLESCRRIISTADAILRAGKPAEVTPVESDPDSDAA